MNRYQRHLPTQCQYVANYDDEDIASTTGVNTTWSQQAAERWTSPRGQRCFSAPVCHQKEISERV
jgi:hypothetical protein